MSANRAAGQPVAATSCLSASEQQSQQTRQSHFGSRLATTGRPAHSRGHWSCGTARTESGRPEGFCRSCAGT